MKIGVLVVAYNAEDHLAETLDRIPRDFIDQITAVLVCDDASQDNTYEVGIGYSDSGSVNAASLPVEITRRPVNLGYGGNQKAGYRWAIETGLDIVVMLHGDGQYAPEFLPEIVQPLVNGKADAVFGSRMMESGQALVGGMPRYKYYGNRILSSYQNALAGTDFTEWHSGYRAYSVAALQNIPFLDNSNGFDFDTEIIVQLVESGAQIAELPIPTYYGDEICHVNGLAYAWNVTKLVSRYRMHKMGFGTGELTFASQTYEIKENIDSSHGQLLSWMANQPPSRVLDLGCSDGLLGHRLRALGHHVTGVDVGHVDGVESRLDVFVQHDLDTGLPATLDDDYDVVLCADVIEHVRDPAALLSTARTHVAANGSLLASVPNFAHWYPRLRVVLGLFDYDRRGILDATHIRFFTRRSFEQLIDRAGFAIVRRDATGLPLEVADRGLDESNVSGRLGFIRSVDRALVRARPQLFGYQFLYELVPAERG
ncbi:MAG: bifunctional glycosyltransferase/class I SAM-dependent methyltransferase [Ilumatobacter sp.]|uniref:bifunctional glycosyltransferase/class I SAM-dependent methyltransferase n=1 Tax=Ilumatobacter sp. TaxID=1967498 RepID=UPI0029EB59F6|nr:bifunctional glycosyltransferase/class I SAM-dependent methyltransferase [Ilumatobacter sp.]MDG2039946.1 bifunctional glycosyltransferase/class I SAM-dependent methyltransferase [Ilumatobacter sp.]